MRSIGKRALSLLLSLIIALGVIVGGSISVYAISSKSSKFVTGYSITGNGAQDTANVAVKQKGKTNSTYGYEAGWCAAFVCDCAKLAGQSKAVPWNPTPKSLKGVVISAGGSQIYKKTGSYSATGFSDAKVGDLVFINWGSSNASDPSHVEIVYKTSGGKIYTVGGNTDSGVVKVRDRNTQNAYEKTVWVVRPKYSSSTPTKPAQVTSISGLKSTYSVGETLSVSWPAASGATKYEVVCQKTNSWGAANYVSSTSYSEYLSSPGDYYFRVDSVNSAGKTTGSPRYFSVVCSNHVRGSYHHMDDAHPHYKYYSCSVCGAVFRTSETGYVSYCNTCNPQYTLQYDANGGTGAPEKFVGNGSINLSTATPSRDGYYFLGWATSSSATTAQYQPGASFILNGSKTLYAVWDLMDKAGPVITSTEITYSGIGEKHISGFTVRCFLYDESDISSFSFYSYSVANGTDDALWDTEDIFIDTGSSRSRCRVFLSDHNYETGYYYLLIKVCDKWGNETTETMTVYVPLDNQIRIIQYNENRPDGILKNHTEYDYMSDDKSITVNNGEPLCSDYIFLGWATSESAIKAQYLRGEKIRPSGDLNLYGVWIKNENPAKGDVDGDGVVNADDSVTLLRYLDGRLSLSENQLQRADYNSDGIVDNEDALAILIELSYGRRTITYSANGGYGTPQAHIGYGNVNISNSLPYRSGYSFIGWATSPDATTAQYHPGDTYTLTEHTLLFAVWEKLYTLTYDANGGSGIPSSQTGNGYVRIPNTVPSRSNYTFLGWAASASTTEAQYNPGDYYSLTKNTTLYAVWETYKCEYCETYYATQDEYDAHISVCTKRIFTLSYNANGGQGAPTNQYGNGNITISSIKPTRSGYTFLGWAVFNPEASLFVDYQPNDNFELRDNETLFAVWQKDETPDTPPVVINPTVGIKNYKPSRSEAYKTTITFTAVTKEAPAGSTVHWIVNGKDVASGSTYTVEKATNAYNIQTRLVSSDNKTLTESEIESVDINTGFFAKLIAFFQGLFGLLPVIEQ